jgi:hypothetical protein
VVKLVAGVWKRLGSGEFLSRVRADPITFSGHGALRRDINLVKLDALAAGAIRHRLVEFSAKGPVPSDQNSKREVRVRNHKGIRSLWFVPSCFLHRLFRNIKRTSRTRWMQAFGPSVFVDRGGL